MTKMISLDTSSKLSGWAYWEDAVLIDHGVIDMSGVKDPEDRLNRMCCSLTSLLADHTPDIVVIEMTVVTTNAKTQRILSEIVGAVRGWCVSRAGNCAFYCIRPTEWRTKVCNKAEKTPRSKKDGLKEWDISKAREYFGFDPVTDDEADAVLIGLAYCRLFVI